MKLLNLHGQFFLIFFQNSYEFIGAILSWTEGLILKELERVKNKVTFNSFVAKVLRPHFFSNHYIVDMINIILSQKNLRV
jgi:hypothetical protein